MSPDIPFLQPLLFPLLHNLFACYPLILSIIPLPNILCDLYFCICPYVQSLVAGILPRKLVAAANFEEFEGMLGSMTW